MRWRMVANELFDDVGRSQMLPVLGGEVVEGEQRLTILDQAFDGLVVFDAPGFDEGVERSERIFLGLGHPDFLERPLGFRVLALRLPAARAVWR